MKVLVTGATGFIGRAAVARLLRHGGAEIVAAGRSPPPSRAPGVAHESVDLLAPGAAAALARRVRPTHLLHLAWNAEPGRFWTAADNLDWVAATLSLLRGFAEAGGERAVLAGSCAEYDWTIGDGCLTESGPLRPATLYGAAKDATRRALEAASGPLGISLAWGRVFWLYGPGEARGRLVADVARALAAGEPCETSEGLQQRDVLHVDDVADAFVTALASPWRGAFNIGSGVAVPVRRVVEILAEAAGRPDLVRFGARPSPAGDPPRLVADIGILRGEMGWTPRIDLHGGLVATYGWWADRARRG